MATAISSVTSGKSAPQENFAALFEESLARQEMRQGELITAEVVRVDYNVVVVNAGLKSESFIPIEEIKDDNGEVAVKPGDFAVVARSSPAISLPLRSKASKTATAKRGSRATRPSVSRHGTTSSRRWSRATSSR